MPIWAYILIAAVCLVLLVGALFDTFFVVKQQEAAIIERFGGFARINRAGLRMKIPFIERIAGRLSLRVQQLAVKVETITKDKVPVTLVVAVQYVIPEVTGRSGAMFNAFYRLTNASKQMESYVFNAVRAKVPTMTLDELFEKQDDIAGSVQEALGEKMREYGYDIVTALVTEIEPDAKVKAAMADINAAEREQAASLARGEAGRILAEKAGQGIADQRLAIVRGLKTALDELGESMGDDATKMEAMMTVLIAQYFDTLQELGRGGATTILLPGNPGGVADLFAQLRDSVIVGSVTSRSANGHDTGAGALG